MRLSLRLQRCPPGRSVKMLPKLEDTMAAVGMEVAGEDTITALKVAVGAMRGEPGEEDTGREEVEEEVEEGEAVTTRATIRMQEVITGEEEEEVMEETTKEASRIPTTMEEEAAAATMTAVITKTEVAVEEVGGVEEEEEGEEEDKEGAGEEEGGRILTKEDSLNSSSSMVGSITARLALVKADIILAEGSAGQHSRVHVDCFSFMNSSKMPYQLIFNY